MVVFFCQTRGNSSTLHEVEENNKKKPGSCPAFFCSSTLLLGGNAEDFLRSGLLICLFLDFGLLLRNQLLLSSCFLLGDQFFLGFGFGRHGFFFFLFAPTEADFAFSGIGSVRELALLQVLRVTPSCVCSVNVTSSFICVSCANL